MDDIKAISIYSQFRKCRKNLGNRYQYAEYHNILKNGTCGFALFTFSQFVQEGIIEIPNSINEFTRYLYDIEAWSKVINNQNEDDVWDTLIEFILPVCYFCLGSPYSIKNKIIASISEISHQANRFKIAKWRDDANLKKQNFKNAKKYAEHWRTWPKLESVLANLNSDEYIHSTSDFRNRYNHGFHRHLEIGLSGTIRREVAKDSSVVYKIGGEKPFRLSEIILHLSKQQKAAISCYEKYIELVREQHQTILEGKNQMID